MLHRVNFFTCIAVISLITIMGGACRSPQPSPTPPRDFTTDDLLINLESMPKGWEVKVFSTNESADDLNFRNNLGGSTIELRTSSSSAEHIVARFINAHAAGQAFADHDSTRDTEGKYASTNEPLPNFTYTSPIADQFRLTCLTIKNILKIGESCSIEAQYKEFLSILLYDTNNAEIAITELDAIAKAIDLQMSKYFGDK